MTREHSQRLLTRLADARAETDKVFGLVDPAAIYQRPIAERHRTIFYVGHLEAFDWNLFSPHTAGLHSFDPTLDQLFAFGIDPVDGGLPADQPSDWPNRRQVQNYVDRARTQLDTALSLNDADEQLLNVAIEHRLMHAETLTYMFHQLPLTSLLPDSQMPGPAASAEAGNSMVSIPAGQTTLGLARDGRQFGWDNEFARKEVTVAAFQMDRLKVSNGAFLQFINAGGYHDSSLWTKADWEWKEKAGVKHPVFWVPAGSQWKYRAMFEIMPLPLNWPVYVSHAEASAYARWAGKRLPTEAEWQLAAALEVTSSPLKRWDPVAVQAAGMFGNGWEWTSSIFAPLPGFEAFSFYPGYSANFFDDQHYVLKGGSPRTAACMLRPSFRNWFQPHYQYVYAGLRCVRS